MVYLPMIGAASRISSYIASEVFTRHKHHSVAFEVTLVERISTEINDEDSLIGSVTLALAQRLSWAGDEIHDEAYLARWLQVAIPSDYISLLADVVHLQATDVTIDNPLPTLFNLH